MAVYFASASEWIIDLPKPIAPPITQHLIQPETVRVWQRNRRRDTERRMEERDGHKETDQL